MQPLPACVEYMSYLFFLTKEIDWRENPIFCISNADCAKKTESPWWIIYYALYEGKLVIKISLAEFIVLL